MARSASSSLARFGDKDPFCEPYWYQGFHSPYYRASHVEFRAKCRKFVEEELIPHVDDWVKSPTGYPRSLHVKAYEAGILGNIYPAAYGGTPPADGYDAFHELIWIDELYRTGGAFVLGQMQVNSMALPPVLLAGSEAMKEAVARPVIMGRKNICLAISEPGAGSDVAGLATTAVRDPADPGTFIVNGTKKWISGGLIADFFTTAVRTGDLGGGGGGGGISLLLIEADRPGITVRKMETQFDTTHCTTFVTLEDVRVPASNLIGNENEGFRYLMTNFNHERFIIAVGAIRMARMCYAEAFKHAMVRKTFGKRLVDHQVIRAKLAEMVRLVEGAHDNMERVAYQFAQGVSDAEMGGACALLKVQASKVFELCAREASQILGGSSVVREGKGKLVERMYREVRSTAIPGGSEEILLDFALRQAVRQAKL